MPEGNVIEAELQQEQPLLGNDGVVERKAKISGPRWPVTTVIKALVMIDMLSVALLVPLLSSYFRDLDIR